MTGNIQADQIIFLVPLGEEMPSPQSRPSVMAEFLWRSNSESWHYGERK